MTAARALLQSPSMGKGLLYEVVPAKAASEFRALPVIARSILKLCDGTRTLDAICARSPLPAESTERVVDRLVGMGLILPRRPVRAQRRPMAPSTSAWIEGALPAVAVAAEPAPVPLEIQLPAPKVELPVVEATPAPVEAAPAPVETAPVAVERANGFSDEEERFFSSSIDHLVADEYAD